MPDPSHAIARMLAGAALALFATTHALAQQPDIEAGRAIAEQNCAACHAIGADDESDEPLAPAFRDLHERYPVEHLAEALAEGIMVGHPEMPVFVLDPHQIESFLAYLRTLE